MRRRSVLKAVDCFLPSVNSAGLERSGSAVIGAVDNGEQSTDHKQNYKIDLRLGKPVECVFIYPPHVTEIGRVLPEHLGHENVLIHSSAYSRHRPGP